MLIRTATTSVAVRMQLRPFPGALSKENAADNIRRSDENDIEHNARILTPARAPQAAQAVLAGESALITTNDQQASVRYPGDQSETAE